MFALFGATAGSPASGLLRALAPWSGSLFWVAAVFVLLLFVSWLTMRHIPNNKIGVVEKLWSSAGSVPEGRIIALAGEAGYQAEVLRGGIHFGYWRWQYVVHKAPLVTVPQGKIGYVYARDGEPLPASQTLARVVPCANFQDARRFLLPKGETPRGQRGRQRAILREGVYAINPALFVIIAENTTYTLNDIHDPQEKAMAGSWRTELVQQNGFDPVIVGAPIEAPDPVTADGHILVDGIGLVTVHDGPSLRPGEIIAPSVGDHAGDPHYHNNFQIPEAFLEAGGLRGRQYAPLTDGTYFINRWFATVEMIPKTVVPIGYVGVVVSYYGEAGDDLSGEAFRHGERVAQGRRGVWEKPLGPGKYAFNTLAGSIVLVPTTNFVLHWVTGKTESHRYDESLRSIDLVTRDAYEPLLPLSVVVHIDYSRAPSVIQRFGDVKKLITQTIDPMLSAYFRDIAHRKTMLELLHDRDLIQAEAREELRRKFHEFDIECVDVLIGKPNSADGDDKIETLLEQLRQRQLSHEQLETFTRQTAAAEKLRTLNEAQAQAAAQTQLTNSRVHVQIVENQAEAELAKARKHAEQTVVTSEGDLGRARRQAEQTILTAEAESKRNELAGRGEGRRVMQIGLSEAAVLLKKISSFGDPRLYALSLVAEHLSHSSQPLVPERLFVAGGEQGQGAQGMLGLLIDLLTAEKSGFSGAATAETEDLKQLADRMSTEAVDALTKP
jgi:uncharacterized membrane protein YqiK